MFKDICGTAWNWQISPHSEGGAFYVNGDGGLYGIYADNVLGVHPYLYLRYLEL